MALKNESQYPKSGLVHGWPILISWLGLFFIHVQLHMCAYALVCGGQRSTLAVTSEKPPATFVAGFLIGLGLTYWASLAASEPPGCVCLHSPALGYKGE